MDSSDKITAQIESYTDWRGDRLEELRYLINETAPELTEDFKWNVPVWTNKPDSRKIARSQDESARAKTILSEGKVAIATSREEKQFAAEISRYGDERALRKSGSGLVCAISGFKDHVKINFFKGAYLPDPKNLFDSGLDSKEHRSINLGESDKLDKQAISRLVEDAVAYNKE